MNDKPYGKGKIIGIKSTTSPKPLKPTESVSETDAVDKVEAIKGASNVSQVRATSRIGRAKTTRIMTQEERDMLLRTVDEEAEKLFGPQALPLAKKEIITKAVKMAIDSGLIPSNNEKPEQNK